ncbi:MAG: M48 family metallopeptidase [Bacilli bacterium]
MNKSTETSITVNQETYPVSIIRKKYACFSIRVRYNLRVFVHCPNNINDEKAMDYLNSNLDWLEKTIKLVKYKLSLFPINEIIAGKKLLWFGDILSIVIKEEMTIPFKFENDFLYVPISYYESFHEIEKFARSIIIDKYNYWLHKLVSNPGSVLPLTFRIMNARWGSCNVKTKHISLNSRLYHLPLGLVTYVIIHELLHLQYPNHGKEFHKRLEKIISGHRRYEKELKNYEVLLF